MPRKPKTGFPAFGIKIFVLRGVPGVVSQLLIVFPNMAHMFVKGKHERQFAYEAHTACDKNGYVLETVAHRGEMRQFLV